MNDIERRTLLGAAGIGAIAALAKGGGGGGGPLDPPVGPIAPSGHTLDDIHNRIPTGSTLGAYDSRIPLVTPGIHNSGSYVLTRDINLSSSGTFTINADNVTLDLNGFNIRGGDSACVYVAGNGVVIRNGTLVGGARGLQMTGFGNYLVAEDLFIRDSVIAGIECINAVGVRIRRCTLARVGYGRVSTAAATGILLSGAQSSSVEDCSVNMYILANTTPALTVGISAGGSGLLVARNNVSHSSPVNGQAFALNGIGVFRENSAINYANQYAVNGTWVNVPGNA